MMTAHPPCPFLNYDDRRCCRRLALVNLPLAFSLCLGNHERCPVYQQLCREQDRDWIATDQAVAQTV
jgi:hypothetical protein